MMHVGNTCCAQQGYSKWPSGGVAGSKVSVDRKQHAEDGNVDVTNERCTLRGCSIRLRSGVEGSKVVAYLMEHAEDATVDVVSERRRTARLQ